MTSPVLACRPVDLTELQQLVPTIDVTGFKVYAHSEERSCEVCGTKIWVGPRIAMAKEIDPDALLVCLLCAVLSAKEASLQNAFHLGNTEYDEGANTA